MTENSLFVVSPNTAPGIKRVLSANVWLLWNTNIVKIIEEFLMFSEKHVFKKMYTNRLNIDYPLCTWDQMTVNGLDGYWLYGKKKVPESVVKKHSHAMFSETWKKKHHFWFPS